VVSPPSPAKGFVIVRAPEPAVGDGAITMLAIFDGHNDSVQRLQEYRPGGIDFLARSTAGHLDLPRAMDGGLVGGLFAMFARPEHPPVNDLTVGKSSYEVRLAEPLDAVYARRKTRELLTPGGTCRRKDPHSDQPE
jgi:hypothetical protein